MISPVGLQRVARPLDTDIIQFIMENVLTITSINTIRHMILMYVTCKIRMNNEIAKQCVRGRFSLLFVAMTAKLTPLGCGKVPGARELATCGLQSELLQGCVCLIFLLVSFAALCTKRSR